MFSPFGRASPGELENAADLVRDARGAENSNPPPPPPTDVKRGPLAALGGAGAAVTEALVALFRSAAHGKQSFWSTRILYAILGAWAVRRSLRAAMRLRTSLLRSTDIYLDPGDAQYLSRGSILEVEAEAALRRLPKLVSEDRVHDAGPLRAVLERVEDAINIKSRGNRAVYVRELGGALRALREQSDRAKAAAPAPGSPAEALVANSEASIIAQARLCDGCLRVARDSLLLNAERLQELRAFWVERRTRDERLNFVRSTVLGAVRRRRPRDARKMEVAVDQRRIVALELLLGDVLARLGEVQHMLLRRPELPLRSLVEAAEGSSAGARSGEVDRQSGGDAALAPATHALADWVDAGLVLVTRELSSAFGGASGMAALGRGGSSGGSSSHSPPADPTRRRKSRGEQSVQTKAPPLAASAASPLPTGSGLMPSEEPFDERQASVTALDGAAMSAEGQRELLEVVEEPEPVSVIAKLATALYASETYRDLRQGVAKARQWLAGGSGGNDALSNAKDSMEESEDDITAPGAAAPTEGSSQNEAEDVLAWALPADRSLPAYQRLERRASAVARLPRAQRVLLLSAVDMAAARRPNPSPWLRPALLAVSAPVLYTVSRRVAANRGELLDLTQAATTGLVSFFREQLYEPVKTIVLGVFFKRRQSLSDRSALEDAKLSLQNMLNDFMRDTCPKIPEAERMHRAREMDMSAVSRQFEAETPRAIKNIVSGQIVRMVIIQTQFIKKELLNAMEAIDDLYNANQVNLQLLAVVPAVLVCLVLRAGLRVAFVTLSSRRLEPTALVHKDMRARIRDVERLLTASRGFIGQQLIPEQLFEPQRHHTEKSGVAASDSSRGAAKAAAEGQKEGSWIPGAGILRASLTAEECGRLALLVYGLQQLVQQNASRFEGRTKRKLEEDLRDLMGGALTVAQQIAVVHRMQRDYAFLASAHTRGILGS